MACDELKPYEDRATNYEIYLYQKNIGSLLYAAVTTRPDIDNICHFSFIPLIHALSTMLPLTDVVILKEIQES
jgi:hypothetical protein